VPGFIETLRECARKRYTWTVIPNVWLVDTDLNARNVASKLRPLLTDLDRVTSDFGGWLKRETWTSEMLFVLSKL
jgi:hypothetical protein